MEEIDLAQSGVKVRQVIVCRVEEPHSCARHDGKLTGEGVVEVVVRILSKSVERSDVTACIARLGIAGCQSRILLSPAPLLLSPLETSPSNSQRGVDADKEKEGPPAVDIKDPLIRNLRSDPAFTPAFGDKV